MCLGRGKAEIGGEKIRFVPFLRVVLIFAGRKWFLFLQNHIFVLSIFTRGSYFRGNKMVHIFAPTSKTRKYEHAKSKNAKMKSARKNGRLQYYIFRAERSRNRFFCDFVAFSRDLATFAHFPCFFVLFARFSRFSHIF